MFRHVGFFLFLANLHSVSNVQRVTSGPTSAHGWLANLGLRPKLGLNPSGILCLRLLIVLVLLLIGCIPRGF